MLKFNTKYVYKYKIKDKKIKKAFPSFSNNALELHKAKTCPHSSFRYF